MSISKLKPFLIEWKNSHFGDLFQRVIDIIIEIATKVDELVEEVNKREKNKL